MSRRINPEKLLQSPRLNPENLLHQSRKFCVENPETWEPKWAQKNPDLPSENRLDLERGRRVTGRDPAGYLARYLVGYSARHRARHPAESSRTGRPSQNYQWRPIRRCGGARVKIVGWIDLGIARWKYWVLERRSSGSLGFWKSNLIRLMPSWLIRGGAGPYESESPFSLNKS